MSVAQNSFNLALVSGVFLGVGTAVIFPAFALVSDKWFPKHQQTLALSLMVYGNYGGWGLGTLIPLVVHDEDSMQTFMLIQACIVSASVPIFLMWYKAEPPLACSDDTSVNAPMGTTDHDHHAMSFGAAFRALVYNRQYWLHSVAYGTLGGLSYSVPAFQADVFLNCMHPEITLIATHSLWINFAFILSGVLVGLVVGAQIGEARQPLAIRVLAVASALSLPSAQCTRR